jgi:WD40 repeat protein
MQDSTPSKDLIADVYHTLREYYSSIRDSASHVYHSALVTMPGCRLHELNSHETGNVALLTARRAAFSPDIMYMQDSITDPTVFALSRDGSRIACYEPHVLWVGNTVSGEMRLLNCPVSTSDPSLRILALQFSLDGRRLSSADNRGIIHVIELEGGDTWTHLPPAKDKDGVLFASSAMFSSGGELCVFNFRLAGLRLQNSPPQKLIPDSRHLAIRQADSGANFYMLPHASSFNLLPDTSNYDFGSKSTFTPDAQCVILASDASIFIWDVARHALRVKISASDLTWSSVLSYIIAVTAVSNTLCASLTLDGTVALWDIVLGVQIRTIIKGNIKSLLTAWALISSSDGGFLGIVLNDTVQVISTAEGHIIAQHFLPPRRGFSDHVGEVGLEFDSRSRLAIAAHAERPIVLWSYKLQANRPPNRITSTAPARNVSRVSFSADGNMLVSDTDDGSITVWKCDTGLPIAHYVGEGVLAAVSLSTPSPRFVISGRETQSVRDPDRSFALQVNDTKTGDVMGPLKSRIKDSMMHAVALSPDDRYLALWFSADTGEVNTTLVVDIHTGQTAARKPDFDKKLRCDPISLSYTPDGLMLVHSGIKGAFSAFKTFIIRDAQTLQARFILDYHNEGLTQTFLSPCSTRVGCVGHDGPRVHLRVWSLESGLELISSPPLEAGHNQHWGLMMPVWTRRQIIWASDESIFTWNLDESTAPVVQGWPRGSTPKSMCVSRDASHIYAWFDDEHIRVWTTADGFVVSGPILELSTSRWPRKVKRSLGRYSSLLSASHHATHLQLILQLGQQYLIVIINLKDGACVRATPFGDGQGMIRPVPILTSNNRIYLRCPVGDKAYLVRWLARIPFNEDDDAAHWFETVTDVSERLQRTLFQVWDLETGEVERIITSSGTQIEFEDLPPSFPLQQSLLQERSNQDIFHSYTPRGARLGVYSTSSMKLVGSLRIPLDRRPAIAGTFDSPNIAVCGTYVAMGSTHGIVSIFDFAKALEAAEARGGVESEAEMPPAE